jgi:hypothetical protein
MQRGHLFSIPHPVILTNHMLGFVKLGVAAEACSVGFWKEVEPYFAYLTPADIWYLHQQVGFLVVLFAL